ncbi:MAG: hypothetical protein GOMPHAMPRED_001501 [Gomphillus americanus]|uniref:Uncharacterized protein n=1 Tax=Gomphillus americanus TaxID=1940652 RepID=A0A8H3FCM4_9LECA|nr:MAG: hypothetical protein GOMPHAMPRED_001501 [Gomphillus americanus]
MDSLQNDTVHEYPDPELFQQEDGYVWPTNDVDSDGNPNHTELRAISSTLRAVWPDGADKENSDDQNSVSSSEGLALPTWQGEILDTDSQSENYDDGTSEPHDSSDLESDPAPPVRAGRRGRPRGRPRGRGRGNRREALDEDEAADHPRNHKRRKAKASKRGDKTVAKRGVRKGLPPSAKFSRLQGEATKLFIEGNYEKAETFANQAVVENPEQFSAHSLLSEIFYEKGDVGRSVAALFAGAHVRQRDPLVWERSADLILERSGDLPMHKMLADAVYCYTRLLSLESGRTDIRMARARLNQELGRARKALRDLKLVLKQTPRNTAVIEMAIELAMEMKKTQEAATLQEKLIDILREGNPQMAETFTWANLYTYSELLIQLGEPVDGIAKLKRVARWICGRGTDDYWEYQTQNDCEFDIDPEPRRIQVLHMADSSYENFQYGEGLPLEIRIHLGILRLQIDDVPEAMRHLEFLRPADNRTALVEDFPDLFRLVGETLRGKGLFAEALTFLEPLKPLGDFVDATYYAHMAYCYRQLGRLDEAETCYRALIKQNENDMRSRKDMVDMFHAAELQHRAAPYEHELLHKRKRQYRPMFNNQGLDDRVALGESHTELEQPTRESVTAPNVVSEVMPEVTPIAAEQHIPLVSLAKSIEKEDAGKWKKRRQHHRKKALESENQEDLQPAFLRLLDLKENLVSGDNAARNTWIESVRHLLRKFRETRVFFPYDRNVKFHGYTAEAQAKALRPKAKQMEIDMELAEMLNVPMDQLPEDNIPDEFCCVPFDDWLDVFLQLAFMMGEDGKRQDCYSILDLVGACNVFYYNKEYMFRITLIGGICAVLLDDDEKVCVVGRHFMTTYQFNSDTYRLYAALFRICARPNFGWYNSGILQKYIMRQIKAVDFCLAQPKDRELPIFEERSGFSTKDAAGNPIMPQRFDIPLLFLYGQILYAAGSYTYALNYFYRARSLDLTNPLINLSLALAYIHHALTRQSLNRHQIIMQGLVFLFQYHDRRIQSNVIAEQQEATYNVARTFHLLGLPHLAIPRYEKVLQLAEKLRAEQNGADEDDENHEDFAVDAAFALQGLYALGGNMRRAKEVVDRWMVL